MEIVMQMMQTIQRMRSSVRRNLGIMIITRGLWTVASNLTAPFLPLYVLELGGSYVSIGEIFARGAVIKVIPGFLGGYPRARGGSRIYVRRSVNRSFYS